METYNPHMRYYTVEFEVDPAVMQKICPQGFDDTTTWLLSTYNHIDKEQKMMAICQVEHNRSECGSPPRQALDVNPSGR